MSLQELVYFTFLLCNKLKKLTNYKKLRGATCKNVTFIHSNQSFDVTPKHLFWCVTEISEIPAHPVL